MNARLKNPLGDNILTEGLRPPISDEDALAALTYLPAVPTGIAEMPRKIRLLHMMALRELHLPSSEELKLFDTLDLITFDSLRLQNPDNATAVSVYAREKYGRRPPPPACAAMIVGNSGTGKSCSILNILSTQVQVRTLEAFRLASMPVPQLVWLSVRVPASGKATDLALALMHETDRLCGTNRFADTLALKSQRAGGIALLDEWARVASSRFLALVHFDEIHNLFDIRSLEKRRTKSRESASHVLSVKDDVCLNWILTFMDGQIASIYSGTPDGSAAFSTRFSTDQRLASGGTHLFREFTDANDKFYQAFLRILWRYQYVVKPLEYSEEMAALILELSGGVMRIIMALWFAAHRVALMRKSDDLKSSDFKKAANTTLAPLKPAIEALRSKDPEKIRNFSDMLQSDHPFWASFWNPS